MGKMAGSRNIFRWDDRMASKAEHAQNASPMMDLLFFTLSHPLRLSPSLIRHVHTVVLSCRVAALVLLYCFVPSIDLGRASGHFALLLSCRIILFVHLVFVLVIVVQRVSMQMQKQTQRKAKQQSNKKQNINAVGLMRKMRRDTCLGSMFQDRIRHREHLCGSCCRTWSACFH